MFTYGLRNYIYVIILYNRNVNNTRRVFEVTEEVENMLKIILKVRGNVFSQEGFIMLKRDIFAG